MRSTKYSSTIKDCSILLEQLLNKMLVEGLPHRSININGSFIEYNDIQDYTDLQIEKVNDGIDEYSGRRMRNVQVINTI